ncbi:unnamed protein product [Paramecium sonneborni]|uniref:PHD-type domain-containing protein n=1 Tax=Paramecium sonneborni TaxID=65129 RepID=A0A8S1N1U5_9CILI|nr:unnamed protein product [Paramecium sonneborni]
MSGQDDPDYEPGNGRKFTFKEFSQDALEQLAIAKNFDKLYKLAEKAPQHTLTYDKLKFNDEIYKTGESILINVKNFEFIATIKKIISIKSQKNDQELPLVIINLYCNKDKIASQYQEQKEYMGMSELFLTEEEHAILVDAIQSKVLVLRYEDYEQYEFKDAVYFTRAFYNTKSEEFLPEISKWPKVCYCKKPQNPDLPYVFCDMCNQWIHLKCEGLTEEQVQSIESFICTYCKGK